MAKLVVFKAYQGDFNQGFCVILQIGDEGQPFHTEINGNLPPIPEISQYYQDWRSIYLSLGTPRRLEAATQEFTHLGDAYQDCLNAADLLGNSLNNWLNSNEFRPVKEKLLENLSKSDEVRVILQVDNILMRLPWHLWDFFELYPKAEIALGRQNYAPLSPFLEISKVRILAILGNSSDIDIKKDRQLLQQLPNAEVHFLPEPKRSEISEQLWDKNWDILFFAGHSHTESMTGKIYINPNDSLNIDELKNCLRKAIQGGLQLAIFNSCDGLGLAQQLADLQIPQVIVMREAIPDKVAQEFLKFFLGLFSKGESLYLSVRNARQRLKDELEKDYPCASWLPVIFQHPGAIPFTYPRFEHQQNSGRKYIRVGCVVTILGFLSVSLTFGAFISKKSIDSSISMNAPPQSIKSPTPLATLAPGTSSRSIDDIYGNFKLRYSFSEVVYESTLKMKGDSGTLLTKFFDKNTNQTKIVEQSIKLEQSSTGLLLLGSDPVYPGTQTPYPNYVADKFIIELNPDGSFNWKTCDDTWNCADVEVEKLP
ncbi:CHAT domain-containing protein [Nostoc sp. ChiQUE01b]|uniref:CHAT domain-containing protein n=1 Tax=Nostoc sp. ChiQUE01b TaxID=3075376 RepID=UPI002AD27A6F|nr:CHAT domain-containing protein [Nostoc sp. ChiQUE01b]MDZ8262889.1 CHAT domain-containing protein [Nostoc sp. ChiQUE01b]